MEGFGGVGVVGVELAAVAFHFGGKEIMDHGGDEGAAEEVAGHHGEDDGHRERSEEILGRAGDEDDGHEDDTDAQGGDEGWHGDL